MADKTPTTTPTKMGVCSYCEDKPARLLIISEESFGVRLCLECAIDIIGKMKTIEDAENGGLPN